MRPSVKELHRRPCVKSLICCAASVCLIYATFVAFCTPFSHIEVGPSHHLEVSLRNSRQLSEITSEVISDEQLQRIISASTHLVSLEFTPRYSFSGNSYRGIVGVFCPLDFKAQKRDPSKLPMFRDLVDASGCADDDGEALRVDFRTIVKLARAHDVKSMRDSLNESNNNTAPEGPHVLSLRGAVFHESRCGSTLTSNSLVALNPTKHRVYSESGPPKQVLKMCGEDLSACSVKEAANLLRDVIYMMGRSNDPAEENMFLKFQSTTTRTMHIFREAFPSTPWIFLYREPVEVMMSQLDMRDISKANCVLPNRKSPMIKQAARRLKIKRKDLHDEEICALHLATICGSAIINLEDANGLGLAVNYSKDLVLELLDYVFPKHFHTPVHKDGYQRVIGISKLYSKSTEGEDEVFESDTNKKRAKATSMMKDAASEFLDPSYKKLEASPYNMNKVCSQVNLDSRLRNFYCRPLSGRKH
eukprot:CCRYP_005536-RA/>CCRYP_005536-RA protein AED:0.33 eAED:0.33 QI:255/-1/1/1/-1/1/1/100/473